MSSLFGTDGVRGVANQDLTPDLAFSIGLAGALVLTEETHHKPTFVVGADTRISCGMLGSALIAGITSAGADVIDVGVIATPGVAWLTRQLGADAGAMISASHNSFEFNGIKLFSSGGFKLADETEEAIEAMILAGFEGRDRPVGDRVGRLTSYPEGAEDYKNHLLSIADLDLSGMRLVIDCAHGASYQTAPALFKALGAEIITLGVEPDGYNINKGCGSTYAENLSAHVLEAKADLGLAFDGDADRLIAVDDQGDVCDGDVMLALLARHMDRRGKLAGKTIVATVMSNFGLEKMAEREGYRLLRTAVGDRNVLEQMLRENLSLGGEQSGHVILLDDTTTGDGQLTALRLLGALRAEGEGVRLSQLRRFIELFPQVLLNVRVETGKAGRIMEDPGLAEAMRATEDRLGRGGRLLVRKSGTEPLIRVMIEGQDVDEIKAYAEQLRQVIEAIGAEIR
jgi:phosphoglucosamine mutase